MNTHILVIDDDPGVLAFLKAGSQGKFRLSATSTFEAAKPMLKSDDSKIDFVLLDIDLGTENGLKYIADIKAINPRIDVIMLTGHKDPALMIKALRLGASDYMVKPFRIDEVTATIEKIASPLGTQGDDGNGLAEFHASLDEQPIIGKSASFREELHKAWQLRGQKANVLIEGESGTGKEIFARYIHHLDNQNDRPFVALNCAAIPDNLLESELFGYEKGSFTGATERKIGKIELASGGDLFLDEIASLKWDLQTKILRAIQEQEILRVGGTRPIKVEVRVIAASNENLEGLVEQQKFRLDLFHRLRVVALRIPPLRERVEDIPVLAEAFLRKHEKSNSWNITQAAMCALQSYPWPGNVRELENLIQSLVILTHGPTIGVSDLPEWIFQSPSKRGQDVHPNTDENKFSLPESMDEILALKKYMSEAEKAYISRILDMTDGDKDKAASLLKMSRTKLYERLRSWGVIGSEYS